VGIYPLSHVDIHVGISAYQKQEGAAEKTINNHLGYLNAVYNYLRSIDVIDYENPLARVKMSGSCHGYPVMNFLIY
jgi:hypothetical protein